MKKFLTLGLVALALTGTKVMNQTRASILNNVNNQSNQHPLTTNFPNRQPAGAQSTKALLDFDYNFDTLVNNQTIFGQDQWVNANPLGGDVAVRNGPGVNPTQTAKGDGGSTGTYASRPLDDAFYYTAKDTKVVWRVWGYVTSGVSNKSAIGGIPPVHFGQNQGGGITELTTYLHRESSPTELTGDVLLHDHWYEYRVVVDFSISGGLATLSYRDVTSGATAFTNDSVLKNVKLGLVPDGSGRYGFSDVYIRNDGAGYVDNLHFDAPAPTATCTTPPPNMVAWWPLDEAQGSQVVHDLAGGHDGTPMTSSGSVTTVGAVGGPMPVTGSYVSNSLLLDGAYVEVPDSQNLNFGGKGKDPFTIDAWVNFYPLQQTRPIVSKFASPNGPGYFLSIEPAGAGVFKLTLRVDNVKYTGPAVPPNIWAFVAATRNATGVTLYVGSNNTLAAPLTKLGSAKNARSTGTPLRIGQWQLPGNVHPHAQIDEVEVFNRALKKTEIEAIFNAGSAGKCKCTLPTAGPVSWWSAESNANDIQDGNNGTLVNGATFALGKFGQAFSFDGVNDGVSILKTGNLNLGPSDFSIEAWVNVAQTQTNPGVVFINYAGVPGYGLSITAAGKAEVGFRPSVPSLGGTGNDPAVGVTGTTSLNDGQWHHLVGVRSGATVLIYVDGVLEGSSTNPAVLTVNGGSVDTGSCQYARIGSIHTDMGHCSSLTPNPQEPNFFQGLIDEVKIYNRGLSASEIRALAGKCGITEKKGMTWYHMASDAQYGTITVGCGAAGPDRCDPAKGDTPCSKQLPVLCIYKPNPAFQKPVGLKIPNIYMEWSGGVVATTPPVAGNTFKDSAAVTAYCQAQFGKGWRVAEFHDAVYWYFQAYGGTVSAPTVPSTRFWVHINDQPNGNCWKP